MIEQKMDSGIDSATTKVLRHEPKNKRIIVAVSKAAKTPSRSTPFKAARTKID